ncbi:MAG: ATP-binding protein [Bacilli bacterium]
MNSFTQIFEPSSKEDKNIRFATIKIKDKYGRERINHIQYFCGESETGRYYVFFLYEITKDSSLSLTQRFAGALISDINLGVLVIDHETTLVNISDLACRMLGVEQSEVLNKPIDVVFHGIAEEHRVVQKALHDGILVRNQAMSWTHNEQRYELLVDSNTLKNEVGEVVGAYVVFKDVTNLRSLEQQVQRSDRLAMIGQIAAGAAHEIRNPLTSVKGFLQVLKYSLMEKGLVKEEGYTDIMLKEIDRINDLVSEFLLLSKPRNLQYQSVSIAGVFKDLLPIIHNEAILYDVELRCEPQHDLPQVIADSQLLKQVFLNICKNGIEAMSEGGILTINHRVDKKEKIVMIDIRDTGPGIPSFVIDKIFDPFYTTKENGTGLGLPVCQRIIHDMGGTIRVSTKGFGTTFSVMIPYS